MGTSSSRTGENAPRGVRWTPAKANVTSFTKGTGKSVAEAVGGFVSAIGGPRAASRRPLSSSIGVGQGLGAFLSAVAARGVDEALRSEGLGDLVGRTPGEVLSGIVDHIAGPGALLDDAIARNAVIEVLSEIFDESQDSYADLADGWREQLGVESIVALMSLFIAHSIFQLFLSYLGDRIESNALSAAEAARQEQRVLEFVREWVSFQLGEVDPLSFDWRGPDGRELVQRALEVALAQLGG